MVTLKNNIILLRETKWVQQPEKKIVLATLWLNFRRNPRVQIVRISTR